MLTLSDKIFIDVQIKPENINQYVTYDLTIYVNTGLSISFYNIFTGRIYCTSENMKLYISDILNDVVYRGELIKNIQELAVGTEAIYFTVEASSDGFVDSSKTDNIICSTPFEFRNITELIPTPAPGKYEAVNINYYITGDLDSIVYPRIPRIGDNNKNFFIASIFFGFGEWYNAIQLQRKVKYVSRNSVDGTLANNTSVPNPLSTILNNKLTDPALLKKITSEPYDEVGIMSPTDITGAESFAKVADIDKCNSEYYLIWANRAFNYQCQPFKKKTYYSEDISSKTLTDFADETRPYLKEVTAKWTLYSDWLSDIERDEFESILISPYIYLYNTKTDKLLPVICNNANWERKTKNNNNKPHNMTIELSSNRKQNILY